MVGLCPNIWCNNPKAIIFLGANIFDIEICFIIPKNVFFRCALCVKVTAFFSLSPNYIVQNPFLNKQICPKFIYLIIENKLTHRSGAKITLCNVAIKLSLLLSHIFYLNLSFLLSRYVVSIRKFNIFIRIF